MLRGAIDQVSPDRTIGWVYSNLLPTTGSTVLAFLGAKCVGAGKVSLLRKDLLGAGLGDGKLGFSIPTANLAPRDLGRIVVRLEGSDFQLVQDNAVVMPPQQSLSPAPLLAVEGRIEWMRQQGWLEQHEINLATQLRQLGAYDLSLRKAKIAGETGGSPISEPAESARHVLCLLQMGQIEPDAIEFNDSSALADLAFAQSLTFPIAAIWSRRHDILMVVEGSHLDNSSYMRPLEDTGAMEHPVGPDRLLLLDLRCSFKARPSIERQACTAFVTKANTGSSD